MRLPDLRHRFVAAGKIYFEGRALPRLAVSPNAARALLDDSVHSGEAQSCPFSFFLRGEERLEDVRQGLGVHSHARVADGQHHMRACGRPRVGSGKAFIQGDVGSFES